MSVYVPKTWMKVFIARAAISLDFFFSVWTIMTQFYFKFNFVSFFVCVCWAGLWRKFLPFLFLFFLSSLFSCKFIIKEVCWRWWKNTCLFHSNTRGKNSQFLIGMFTSIPLRYIIACGNFFYALWFFSHSIFRRPKKYLTPIF